MIEGDVRHCPACGSGSPFGLRCPACLREVIRLTDDELTRPDCADMAMAVRRNGALRFTRSHFAGRVIHSSPEHWKREMFAYLAEERGERIRRDEN